jgi:DNA-binding GntR family transcriptional regulator
MTAIRVQSLVDQVHAEIKARIAAGAYPSGTDLGIAATARDLGVSATPVREAFARLAAEGVLAFSANIGYRIAPGPSASDYTNWAVARIVVESNALLYIMGPIDARLLAEAAAINDEIRNTRFGKDAAAVKRYSELNWAFHAKLLALARNETLSDLHARLYAAPQFARIFLGRGIPNKTSVIAEHDAILAALRAGNPEGAAKALRAHVADSLERDARMADVSLSLQRVTSRKSKSNRKTRPQEDR